MLLSHCCAFLDPELFPRPDCSLSLLVPFYLILVFPTLFLIVYVCPTFPGSPFNIKHSPSGASSIRVCAQTVCCHGHLFRCLLFTVFFPRAFPIVGFVCCVLFYFFSSVLEGLILICILLVVNSEFKMCSLNSFIEI